MRIFKKNNIKTGGDDLFANHSLFVRNENKANLYKLYIGDFDHNPSELDKIIYDLENATDFDALEISIHSYGGYVYEMQRLENVIKTFFKGRTTTVLNPMGYSAGGFLFLMGDERFCFENSQIMLHNASGGFFGKFNDIKENIKFETDHLEGYFKRILKDFLSETELEDFLSGKEFWFNTKQMCERNICTHVLVDGIVVESQEYLKQFKTPVKSKKSVKPTKPTKSTKKTKDINT